MANITEWFKVIRNGQILGAATNQSFARYYEKNGRLHICDAVNGQYIFLNNRLYRDKWMLPLGPKAIANVAYEDAMVLPISKNDYDILSKIDGTEPMNNEIARNAESIENEDIHEKRVSETDRITIDAVRKRKLEELSAECREMIEMGFDTVLGDEELHHFSMSVYDQMNLLQMEVLLNSGAEDILYHADGELTQYFSQEDARYIVNSARRWKEYNMARYNSFRNWINTMTDISEIDAVTYDTSIPEAYCSIPGIG